MFFYLLVEHCKYSEFLPNTNNFSIMERCQDLLGYWFDNTAVNWDCPD